MKKIHTHQVTLKSIHALVYKIHRREMLTKKFIRLENSPPP